METKKPAAIPLSLSPVSLPAQLTVGAIRHMLTTFGGYWIALGLTNADPTTLKWGVGMTAIGALWSWAEKIVKRYWPGSEPETGQSEN